MRSFAWTGVSDSIAQALSANQDFSLGLCARVDMGVNYQGWTREETTEYMNQFGMGDEDTVTWLYEAVVAEPSNYLSYYIGYKEFEALRAEAEEALGTDFDPVSFHEFILTTGPAPFDLIREQMDVWISQVNDGNAQAA